MKRSRHGIAAGGVWVLAPLYVGISTAIAAPIPGGTLDPTTIPKYVQPLVIPPELPRSPAGSAYHQGVTTDLNVAVREFRQQILPGGVWNVVNGRADAFAPTPVWSYGRAEDPVPLGVPALGIPAGVAPVPAVQSSFNYPAFTVENLSGTAVTVRWINELVDIDPATGKPYPKGSGLRKYKSHLVPVDQSLHWANPGKLPCMDGTGGHTDCRPNQSLPALRNPYPGPVPMVVHVHGAEDSPESDGYAEAWWLPDADNLPRGYAKTGRQYRQEDGYANVPNLTGNTYPASAAFGYSNIQPAATIWYHDHTLGMTHNNVYAGPAGYWLIRGGEFDGATDGVAGGPAVLPGEVGAVPGAAGRPTDPTASGCDPNFDEVLGAGVCRSAIREIPVAIQDRSFNADGTLFYPKSRNFFEGLPDSSTLIPYVPSNPATCGPKKRCSDIAPIWNPEFFGNAIVVNGTTWPVLDVAPQRYRLRLLNGCDSRMLNLALYTIPPGGGDPATLSNTQIVNNALAGQPGWQELPFYQIGAEQGFLPNVVKVATGFRAVLPGDGTDPPLVADPACAVPGTCASLVMGNAERPDVIVDFTGLPEGTVVRMVNTGPDEPFGGFPTPPSDESTTGQIMHFVVGPAPAEPDPSTAAANLVLNAEGPIGPASNTRALSLNEESSGQICVRVNAVTGAITRVVLTTPQPLDAAAIEHLCASLQAVPFGPREALVGTLPGGVPKPQLWSDPITQNVPLNATEEWEIYNYTVDAHPIHLHQVRFQVVSRQNLVMGVETPVVPATLDGPVIPPDPTEAGYKDTVISYPGQVVRVRATFNIGGLYVWHCHIVEHEDNEMMVPFCVGGTGSCPAPVPVPIAPGA
jgi:FtsP/CotA-like multicopper oxidase with cupredoxin domain